MLLVIQSSVLSAAIMYTALLPQGSAEMSQSKYYFSQMVNYFHTASELKAQALYVSLMLPLNRFICLLLSNKPATSFSHCGYPPILPPLFCFLGIFFLFFKGICLHKRHSLVTIRNPFKQTCMNFLFVVLPRASSA